MTFNSLDSEIKLLHKDDYLEVAALVERLRRKESSCSEPDSVFAANGSDNSFYSKYQEFQKLFADVFHDPEEMECINHLYDEV